MKRLRPKGLYTTINYLLITINKMETIKPDARILNILLKDLITKHTITSLAKEISMSRVGVWKVLKRLNVDKLITLSQIGTGKTSVCSISLDWDNPLTEKTLILALAKDAQKNRRWLADFAELEDKVDFLVIYGSILHSPKEANDIDILGVTNKNKFLEIEKSVRTSQKTLDKRIHSLNFTPTEFKNELEKPNKAFIDAVKRGRILFGQEKFIKFIRTLSRKWLKK